MHAAHFAISRNWVSMALRKSIVCMRTSLMDQHLITGNPPVGMVSVRTFGTPFSGGTPPNLLIHS